MATSQRIKVRVTDLVARINARKAEAKAEYEAEQVEYANAVAERARVQAERKRQEKAWLKSVAAEVADFAKRLRAGDVEPKFDSRYWGHEYVDVVYVPITDDRDDLPDIPSEPREPYFDPSQYDKDISLLSMSTDDIITVSTNDRWARYL